MTELPLSTVSHTHAEVQETDLEVGLHELWSYQRPRTSQNCYQRAVRKIEAAKECLHGGWTLKLGCDLGKVLARDHPCTEKGYFRAAEVVPRRTGLTGRTDVSADLEEAVNRPDKREHLISCRVSTLISWLAF